jgi:hypothetical protein
MQSGCAVLYYHLCPVWVYHIFSTLSHKGQDFRKKKLWDKKVCFYFLCKFVCSIAYSKKNRARCCYKCTRVFMWSARNFCHILTTLEFSRQVFEKYSNIKFHENPSSGSRVASWGQTEMTKLIVVFAILRKRLKKILQCATLLLHLANSHR